MPEIITRYPDVTLKVLRESGARCGEGEQQQILTKCPKERFCKLPTGEVCVLGVGELLQAQQVTPATVVAQPFMFVPLAAVLVVLFFVGFVIGRRSRGGARQPP